MDKSSLVYPIFVREGRNIQEEIPTMPGQYRYTIDKMPGKLEELKKAGVDSVIFSGFRKKRMKQEAGPMQRMELYRRLSERQNGSLERICI